MKFWASCEVYEPAQKTSNDIRILMEKNISILIRSSRLSMRDVKIRYVPIIMPNEIKERYPARSRAVKSEGVYNCCPQLDYEAFVSGDLARASREYANGIISCSTNLSKIGLDKEDILNFRAIIHQALSLTLNELT